MKAWNLVFVEHMTLAPMLLMLENEVDFGPMRTLGIYTPLEYILP